MFTVPNGTSYTAVKIKEWNPYATDGFEYKYYASGEGLVLEADEEGLDPLELISEQD